MNLQFETKGELASSLLGENGYPVFMLFVTGVHDHYVDLEVMEVTAWGEQDNTPFSAEKYLSATVKWDGCCHVSFGDKDGYIHMCGVESWKQHCKMMEWVYKEATKLIPDMVEDQVWK